LTTHPAIVRKKGFRTEGFLEGASQTLVQDSISLSRGLLEGGSPTVLSDVFCAPKSIYLFSAALPKYARPMIPVPKRTKLLASEKFDTNAEHPDINSSKNMKTKVVCFISFVVVLPVNGSKTEVKRWLQKFL
jgi:hypothetical protein